MLDMTSRSSRAAIRKPRRSSKRSGRRRCVSTRPSATRWRRTCCCSKKSAAAPTRFDVLHFHIDYYPFSLFARQPVPFLTTMHGRLDLPELQPIFNTFSDVPVVSISDNQRQPLPQAHWLSTVYHGLPENLLEADPQRRSRATLAFLGRISPEKRVDRAIRIAQAAGMKIKDRREARQGRPRLLRRKDDQAALGAAARRVHR